MISLTMNILVVVKTGDFLINDMLDMQTMSPCRALTAQYFRSMSQLSSFSEECQLDFNRFLRFSDWLNVLFRLRTNVK